jgi:phenylalanyl-tRNA synthetase alpha chain
MVGALTLSEGERAVLGVLRSRRPKAIHEDAICEASALSPDAVRGALQRMRSKGLVLVEEDHHSTAVLTRKGEEAKGRGLPERRLYDMLRTSGKSFRPEELPGAGFSDEERSAAIGLLRRRKVLAEGIPLSLRPDITPEAVAFPEEATLHAVATAAPVATDTEAFRSLLRRGLVSLEHRTERRWTPSETGATIELETSESPAIGMLTARMLTDGSWHGRAFRPYDVRAIVPFVRGARVHPYVEWLREFEEILIGLGFEEAAGPLIETEFWNADVLFMPQDHPARSIHDMLTVERVRGHPPEAALLERVAAAHEGRPIPPDPMPLGPGWRAPYDRDRAAQLVARSQTTAVSARYLARHPKPPFRMYSIGRNFRYESVDALHHIEFDQCEGILGEEGASLRHLIGLFRSVADALHIPELKFRPSYFPFTEPSVEGYARHPHLGWTEVFPGGMLRPEVLRPLGVDVPVAAWGIGITRLAMVSLGVSDIRDLYLDDLSRLTTGSE